MDRTKRNIISIFSIIALCSFFHYSYAEVTKINAGVITSIWYSEINTFEGNTIQIFGGVQNHSSSTFSFRATLFVDDAEIYTTELTSHPDSLLEISAPWKAIFGSHIVQLKITEITSKNTVVLDSLLTNQSNKNTIFVAKDISFNKIAEDVKDNASNKLSDIAEKINNSVNTFTDTLADKIDNLKTNNATSSPSGEVLGAETKYQPASLLSSIKNNRIVDSVYNSIIGFLAMIVRSWKISLIVIIVIAALIKFML